MPSLYFRLLLFCLSVLGCYLPLMLPIDDDIYDGSELQRVLSLEEISVNEFLLLVGTFSGCIFIAALRLGDLIVNLNEMNVIVEFYERLLIIVSTMQMGCLFLSNTETSSSYYCQLFICSVACQRICWSTAIISLLNYYIHSEFDDATALVLNIWLTVPEVLSCFVTGEAGTSGLVMVMLRFSGLGVLLFSLLRWTYHKLGAFSLCELSFMVLELVCGDEELMALAYLSSLVAALLAQHSVFYTSAHARGWAGLTSVDLVVYAGSLGLCNVVVMVCSSRIIRNYTIELRDLVTTKREYDCYVVEKMREPLSVVVTGVQVLAEELESHGGTPALRSNLLAEIGACDEISRLLDIYLDNVHSVEAFSTENELGHIVELSSFVESSLFPFVNAAKSKHITFSTLNGCQDCKEKFVKMDANKLNQVMRDVLTNALQYTPEGGFISVTANTFTSSSPRCCGPPLVQEFVSIKVKDSGIGVVKRYLPNLFNTRVRIRNNKLVEFPDSEPNDGTAMSLAVARQVLEHHSGSIRVESGGIGQGTTVILTLPTVPDDHPGEAMHMDANERYAATKSAAYYEALTSPVGRSDATPVPKRVPASPLGESNRDASGPSQHVTKPAPASSGAPKAPWRPSRLERIVSAVELYPAESAADSKAPHESDSEADGRKRRFGDSLHVLIVDPSAMSCKILGRLVELLGHTHETAEDGQLCLDQVQANTASSKIDKSVREFDVIMLEDELPRVNGPEAVRMLRTVLNFRGAIIGVTSSAVPSTVSSFIEQGAQQILLKPVSVDQLKGAFKSCVSQCEEKYGEYASDGEGLDSFTDMQKS